MNNEEICEYPKSRIFECVDKKIMTPELENHLNMCRECAITYVVANFLKGKSKWNSH